MAAAACNQDAADRSSATAAGKAGSLIHAVLDLKQAGFARGVDVVRNGGTTQADRMLKNLPESDTQSLEFGPREAARHAAGADSGTEQALVGVNVSDAGEERLIEESGFDGKAAIAEERRKCLGGDGKWLETGNEETFALTEVLVVEAAEAAGIDETEFAAAQKGEAHVRVGRHRNCRVGDEKAACHAQVNNPLRFWSWSLRSNACLRTSQIANDVLARAMDRKEYAAHETAGEFFGRDFEGLAMGAEPNVKDSVAADSLVDASGDGFHFGKFGHRMIIASHQLAKSVTWPATRALAEKPRPPLAWPGKEAALLCRVDLHVPRVTDPAGLKTYDFPFALGISNVNAGIAETAEDFSFGAGALHLCAGSHESRIAVETDSAVRNVEGGDVDAPGTEAGEPVLLGLQGTIGSDGGVVVSQKRVHGAGVGSENRDAPGFFELVDFAMPMFVFLELLPGGIERHSAEGQKEH